MLPSPVIRARFTMVQALTILTALQMFSEGNVPKTEAAGGPYGIDRGVVEGAALAGSSFTPSPSGRDLGNRPVPALSQVTPTSSPNLEQMGGVADQMGEKMEIPLVPERTPCNGGLGELRYEKLPDVRLVSRNYDSDVIRKNAMPSGVLALCEDRCLKDRTGAQMLPKQCSSIDFVPGRRFSSFSDSIEFTETKCFLSQSQDEGTLANSISQFERAPNYAHLREVCYPATTSATGKESPLRTDCPDRLYVSERILGKRFIPKNAIEVTAATVEDCQNACVSQQQEDPANATTICRAGTWNRARERCYLSSYTRRTHPFEFVDDADMDYFENTCLSAERRCPKNQLFYLKEVNAELGGPFDSVTFVNVTLDQCKEKCIESKTIFCRSMEYDIRTRVCVLSDEDSVSKRDEMSGSTSNDNIYLELQCFDGEQIKGEYLFESDTPITSPNTEPLNARSFRDVYTAFQLYRNRNLQLKAGFRNSPRQQERNRVTLAECLDECLEERTFACRSVSYSQQYQVCRLSEYDQYNGDLQYDGEYDYFENLMGAGGATGTSERNPQDDVRIGGSGATGSNGFVGADRGNDVRFDSFNRNNIDGNRGGALDSRFELTNPRLGERGDGKADSRVNRPSPFDDRPGLFRPISTDFTRNTFDRNNERDSFRERGPSNGFNNNFRGDSNRGGSSSGGGSGGGGLGLFDLFTRGGSGSDRDRNNNRFGSNTGNRRNPDNAGRFSSTALGTVADNERFGSDSSRRPGFGSSGLFQGGSGSGGAATSSLGKIPGEVAQNCNDDGSMEFSLRTQDPFRGRIYVYGYYDRCFTVGRGSTGNTLKISASNGFPDCGTIRYGDTITNIVVVQFSENVQTMMDKRYNLTCTTIGPTDSVVTSSYIGAGYGVAGVASSPGGGPTQIEYLELENRLDQKVALRVLYDGRPTTTIAVGDPLTFRLEPQAGYNLVSDIFATNVVARDPYSGRTVQLIDSRGCPVDDYIFPALGRARSGDGLETRFSAFKIPESNFLVFEANVRPCKGQCGPAFCRDNFGREETESYGRKRRDVTNVSGSGINESLYTNATEEELRLLEQEKLDAENEPTEHVHGIYEVYLSRDEIPSSLASSQLLQEVCLSPASYNGLLVGLVTSILLLLMVLFATWLAYRYYMRGILSKNSHADSVNPLNQFSHQPLHDSTRGTSFPGSRPRTVPQPNRYFPEAKPEELALPNSDGKATFRDPSEPIYTDPKLFEKASSSKVKVAKSAV